jgi:hypothetical protein
MNMMMKKILSWLICHILILSRLINLMLDDVYIYIHISFHLFS